MKVLTVNVITTGAKDYSIHMQLIIKPIKQCVY